MAKIPQFKTDEEASDFWDTHDSTGYLDDTEEVSVTFIDVRPRMEQISLRLPPSVIAVLKVIAGKRAVGYQTLIRLWVMERLQQESELQHGALDTPRPLSKTKIASKKAPRERKLA